MRSGFFGLMRETGTTSHTLALVIPVHDEGVVGLRGGLHCAGGLRACYGCQIGSALIVMGSSQSRFWLVSPPSVVRREARG